MNNTEIRNIQIVVDNEQDLYTKFNPQPEFSDAAKTYIRSKTTGIATSRNVNIKVIAYVPIDENRFRSAISNWIQNEREVFDAEKKEILHTLFALLIFGSVLLLGSIYLEKVFDSLRYSLLPIMGSLALSRAAGILILDIPTNNAKKGILNKIEQNNVITFEYVYDISQEEK